MYSASGRQLSAFAPRCSGPDEGESSCYPRKRSFYRPTPPDGSPSLSSGSGNPGHELDDGTGRVVSTLQRFSLSLSVASGQPHPRPLPSAIPDAYREAGGELESDGEGENAVNPCEPRCNRPLVTRRRQRASIPRLGQGSNSDVLLPEAASSAALRTCHRNTRTVTAHSGRPDAGSLLGEGGSGDLPVRAWHGGGRG